MRSAEPVYGVRAIWRDDLGSLIEVARKVFGAAMTMQPGESNVRTPPTFVVVPTVRAAEALCGAARQAGIPCMGWDIRRQIPTPLESCRR